LAFSKGLFPELVHPGSPALAQAVSKNTRTTSNFTPVSPRGGAHDNMKRAGPWPTSLRQRSLALNHWRAHETAFRRQPGVQCAACLP
jgi:hypothetical protein